MIASIAKHIKIIIVIDIYRICVAGFVYDINLPYIFNDYKSDLHPNDIEIYSLAFSFLYDFVFMVIINSTK